MQAVILAGGQGTRLRPLTASLPKPVVPLAGRPLLVHTLDWLLRHGCEEFLLCCGFRAEAVRAVLGESYGGAPLRYLTEPEPLGTAGPVRLALEAGLLDDRFCVLNGDILTDIDLSALADRHRELGATATLGLIAVQDTTGFGVVPTADDGAVEAFLEKSDAPVPTNRVNAGIYVLERALIDRIEGGRPVSFEREVFPGLVADGLYGHPVEGYWVDVGTPERYLEATFDLLAGVLPSNLPPRDESGSLIADGCITSGARIGPQTVLGPHCSVGAGARVERSVLHERVVVGEDAAIREGIVAAGARLGPGVRIEPGAVVGGGVQVAAGAVVARGERIDAVPDEGRGGSRG